MVDTLKSLWRQRRSLVALIMGDFSQNYLASYLGFAWAILGPLVMVGVMAAVFEFGFRASPVTGNVPFPLWLICGMLCWQCFSDGLTSGATAVTSYAFLVRKAVFRISYLPAIRLLAGSIIHAALMLFLLGVLFIYDFPPRWHWLQFFYYYACMYMFLLGVSWCTSAVAVFVPDVVSVLGIATNLGFWATPIFWNPSLLPEGWQWLFQVNPAYYLVQGYRDAFVEQRWLWERPLLEHGAFFCWLLLALVLGAFTFKKLRPHFADVL